MEAVYAFCRAVDDVVDREGGTVERAQEELNRWRRELAHCAAGAATHPIAVALTPVISRYQIPLGLLEKLISGVEMDLSQHRYATFGELKRYCEHVAAAVGLISVRIFGCSHPTAERYATSLGIALQLTNILRDIQQDAVQGRVYLPQEDLVRFGCSEDALLAGRRSEGLERLLAFTCDRARTYFSEAEAAFRQTPQRRRLISAQIMAGVYRQILARIEDLHYDVFSSRVTVTRPRQLWIAARVWVGAN